MEAAAWTGMDELYSPPEDKAVEVNVPKMKFIMIDGQGAPGSEAWIKAVRTISAVDQAIRSKMKAKGVEYPAAPFESLLWADKISDLVNGHKENWLWTCMLRQPDSVTPDDLRAAAAEAHTPIDPGKVRLEDLEEGLAAQKLHVGPLGFSLEGILKLRALINERGGAADGHVQKFHQVYLSDMRATPPDEQRFVLRQPFRIA